MRKLSILSGSLALFVSLQSAPAADETVATQAAPPALQLPSFFGDNMVLQQKQPVPVWGWARPGTEVAVKFAGQTKQAKADADGRWEVRLKSLKASSQPANLVVEAGETRIFTNILVGEVWLCSGQSNMEKPIGKQPGQKPVFNADQELAAADFPEIRLFKAHTALAAEPQKDVKPACGWLLCDSNSLEAIKFSAAGYFFGREIHRRLKVPVGLIESSWGGTRIEPWTPPEGFKMVPSLAHLAAPLSATNKLSSTTPMAIYHAMIAPLARFAMRGALWYQGESNCMGKEPDGPVYTDKMAALVGGWRKLWHEGDFPFYYVQIAPFKYYSGNTKRVPDADALPVFWEAQTRALRIKNTGMVVTTDITDDLKDIHPRNKQDVGKRLALLALNKTYGQKDVTCSGPVFKKMKIKGPQAVLTFDDADGGLVSKDNQPLTWFSIAGADKKFVPAQAIITHGTVVVSSPDVAQPVAVRFAWSELAQPNFANQAGLPAVPFRTDQVSVEK
ncbi:MAG TPA: sialate O-acetylesterase [Candidatus Acidoferrum sp.]|nr:sialate O-acetylesterase [Candidatus Acidoferrum sp.]